ncbi:hypothetical protein HKX48_002269, partial [Thoreauomyces humboldtii]
SNAVGANENLFLVATHPEYVKHYVDVVLPALSIALTSVPDLLSGVQTKHLLAWLQAVCDVTATSLEAAIAQALEKAGELANAAPSCSLVL